MKYRNVDYSVVQVQHGVWKWSATVDAVSIAGLATSESQAAVGAENAVDQALAQKALRATDARKPHE